MSQQIGIISSPTLAITPPMNHERPSVAQRLCGSPNSVASAVCAAATLAAAGLLSSGASLDMLVKSRTAVEVVFGVAGVVVGAGSLGIASILGFVACRNLATQRMNRIAEVERSIQLQAQLPAQLPVVADAANRV